MKIVGFRSEVNSSGQIAVPPEIAARIPPGETVQVVLQWGLAEEDGAWRTAGRRQFEAAYSDDGTVYESLIDDSATPSSLASASLRRRGAKCGPQWSSLTPATTISLRLPSRPGLGFPILMRDTANGARPV